MQGFLKGIMIKLSCKESGLDCEYIAEGKTVDEVLKDISEHSVNVHKKQKHKQKHLQLFSYSTVLEEMSKIQFHWRTN